jgi:phosphoribosyl-ATP pyrophosphohydrolase/phosphoribosyl-AMP cyclohydrolase
VIASLAGDAGELVAEASDLVYHLLVLLLARGVEPDRLAAELVKRHASPGGSP